MIYKIVLSGRVKKILSKTEKALAERFHEKIEKLKENPRQHGAEKLKGEKDSYRVRVGKYRIVYDIHDDKVLVLVVNIDHRKDVYR